jgi:hypothetical protein
MTPNLATSWRRNAGRIRRSGVGILRAGAGVPTDRYAVYRRIIRTGERPTLGMSVRIGTASKIDVIAKHCPMLPDPDPAAAVVAVAAHAGGEACMCDLTEPVAFAADGLAPHEGCWSTPGC